MDRHLTYCRDVLGRQKVGWSVAELNVFKKSDVTALIEIIDIRTCIHLQVAWDVFDRVCMENRSHPPLSFENIPCWGRLSLQK